jgi:hypothetical protein
MEICFQIKISIIPASQMFHKMKIPIRLLRLHYNTSKYTSTRKGPRKSKQKNSSIITKLADGSTIPSLPSSTGKLPPVTGFSTFQNSTPKEEFSDQTSKRQTWKNNKNRATTTSTKTKTMTPLYKIQALHSNSQHKTQNSQPINS